MTYEGMVENTVVENNLIRVLLGLDVTWTSKETGHYLP